MKIERRNFLRMAAAYSVGNTMWTALPGIGSSQLPLLGMFEEMAPAVFKSLLNLGGQVLSGVSVSYLSDWLKSRFATPAPPAQTFAQQFNLPIQIVQPAAYRPPSQTPRWTVVNNNVFQSQTKLPARTVIVNAMPHVVDSNNPVPSESTHVNVPEMDEIANTSNPLLYKQDGSRLIKLPFTIKPRLIPNDNDKADFIRLAYSGGVPVAGPLRNLDSRLTLDYVRIFCGCDGPLKGYAYRDKHVQDGGLANFAIRQA